MYYSVSIFNSHAYYALACLAHDIWSHVTPKFLVPVAVATE